jgi:hypothetical protein
MPTESLLNEKNPNLSANSRKNINTQKHYSLAYTGLIYAQNYKQNISSE